MKPLAKDTIFRCIEKLLLKCSASASRIHTLRCLQHLLFAEKISETDLIHRILETEHALREIVYGEKGLTLKINCLQQQSPLTKDEKTRLDGWNRELRVLDKKYWALARRLWFLRTLFEEDEWSEAFVHGEWILHGTVAEEEKMGEMEFADVGNENGEAVLKEKDEDWT